MDRKTFNCACGNMFTRKNNLQRHKKQSCNISHKSYPERSPNQVSLPQRQEMMTVPPPKQRPHSKSLILKELHDLNKGLPENSRERSENIHKMFRKLNTIDNTPVDFQPEKLSSLPHDDTEESSLGSLRIDDSDSIFGDEELQSDTSDIEEESEKESDVSSAEDEEDENMDKKVWHVILHYSNKNDCTLLEAFKYFCRWCRALEEDPIIEKVIDSAQVSRDENTGFKKALNEALNKRKFLILRAIKENRDGIVWDELEGDPDVLDSLRRHILFSRAMKRDPTFQSVMEYKKECMEDEDMDSDEALDHSIDEKSTDIAETQGKGLYLHPYGKGLAEEEGTSDDVDGKIWKIIVKNKYRELSSVIFFCRLHHNIDHDLIFQQVLNKIQKFKDKDENITFKDALDNVMEKEKWLIHQGFANAKEDECDIGNENVWCLMLEESEYDNVDVLKVFKIYILYYQSMKSDKVFQAIMKTLDIARDIGSFEDGLNFAIQENKSQILQAIDKEKKAGTQRGLLYM